MQKDTDHDRNAPTGRKNRFCARRMAAWRCEAERLAFDVLVAGGTASSGSLRKNCKENVDVSASWCRGDGSLEVSAGPIAASPDRCVPREARGSAGPASTRAASLLPS